MKRHWSLWPPVQLSAYLLLRVLLMVVHAFPHRAAPWLGRWLGRALRVNRKGLRTARKNVARADVAVSLDRVYENIGTGLVEMLMIPRLLARGELAGACRMERFEVFDRLLAEGNGIITVIGHLGNYELGGLVITQAGYPLNSLARPIINPWINRYLTRFREMTGQRVIPTGNPVAEMVRVLRRNEILVIEIDQDAKGDGILVDFLGRPASVYRSPALFSIKYGAPIVVAAVHREPGVGNVCVLSDPIRPDAYRDRPDGIEALTRRVTAALEERVRAHPDQWFWVYDRWRGASRILRKREA